MGEAVQHPGAPAEPPHRLAVILLVQEEAGLLAVLHIHEVADPVLHDLHLGVKGSPQEALVPFHPLLEADLGVAALIDAPDGDAVLGQQLLQQLHDGDLEAVDAQSQGLYHQHVGELVHHQPRQEVRLPENQAAAAGVHHLFPVLPGVFQPHEEEILVDLRVRVPGEHPNGKLGAPVQKALAQRPAVLAADPDQAAVLRPRRDIRDLIVIDPGAAFLQVPSLSLFQCHNSVCHKSSSYLPSEELTCVFFGEKSWTHKYFPRRSRPFISFGSLSIRAFFVT